MEREVISYRCLGEKDRIWRGQLCPSRFLSDRAIERSLKITSDLSTQAGSIFPVCDIKWWRSTKGYN